MLLLVTNKKMNFLKINQKGTITEIPQLPDSAPKVAKDSEAEQNGPPDGESTENIDIEKMKHYFSGKIEHMNQEIDKKYEMRNFMCALSGENTISQITHDSRASEIRKYL